MADYQEYRRRILHKRWRRRFIVAALLFLGILLGAVGTMWRTLHRTQVPDRTGEATILQQALPGNEWNTLRYTPARQLNVQTRADGSTALDFRMAALPESPAVDKSVFCTASFLGDSLTQGMQIYSTGWPAGGHVLRL